MIDKELRAYRTYQRFLRILLTMCSCWYMPTKSGKCLNFGVVGALLVMILYATVSLNMCYIHRHNWAIMMKCVGFAISSFSTILKIFSTGSEYQKAACMYIDIRQKINRICRQTKDSQQKRFIQDSLIGTFLHNRASLINYQRTLNDLFEEELLRNKKIRTIILSSLPTVYTLAYTYSAIMLAQVFAFSMPAYLSIIVSLCRSQSTTNYSLPFTRYHSLGDGYFWTVPRNYLYHFHLLFETGEISISVIMGCSMDNAFGFHIYQFASVLHAMTFRLTNLLPTENFSDVLNLCVAKYKKLLPCRHTLEHIFGPIVLWHIVTNAVLLCALIHEAMSISDSNNFSIGASVAYATIKLLQMFMYAWYGTLLTNASEDFRKGIYFSEWPNSDLDHNVRTNIIIMMIQKPMTINAIFTLVDMNMFTNFVNTTVSYFFLLQSISEKGK